MGYTHYFRFIDKDGLTDLKPNQSKFILASSAIKRAAEELAKRGIEITGYDGTKNTKPVFNGKEISFNGLGSDACEPFKITSDDSYLPIKPSQYNFREYNPYNFPHKAFCKTKKKKYDILVCFALLTLKKIYGERFEYSSDGINLIDDGLSEEWEEAKKFFNEMTPRLS